MIEVMQSAPILSRVLLVVLIVTLLLVSAQLITLLFSSFRSWKFSVAALLIMLLSAWGGTHLYAITFIRPPSPVVEQEQCTEPNGETNTPLQSDGGGEDGEQ